MAFIVGMANTTRNFPRVEVSFNTFYAVASKGLQENCQIIDVNFVSINICRYFEVVGCLWQVPL